MKKILAFILLITAAVSSHGQAISVNGGSIQGTVTDASGAAIPSAVVTISSPETGYTHTVKTDSAGYYSVGPLNPGNYSIIVAAPNFQRQKIANVVRTGTATNGNVRLTVGSQNETVEVNAGALQVNTDQVSVSDVITREQIEDLPVNGRNFLDLAQIEPGVILQSGESFDPTKAGYSAISVSGVSGRTTRILLDGQDITDETVGTTIFNVSTGAIDEFQLNRSTQDVSGDVTSTGQVLVSTRSGTNQIHGQLFYDFQDYRAGFAPAKNANNPPFQRNQFGGSVGGPIIKDKLFFFANVERIKQDASAASPVSTGAGSRFSAIYAAHPSVPSPYRQTYSTGRLDWTGPFGGHYFARANYNVDSDSSNFGYGYWLYANRDNTPGYAFGADFSSGKFTHSFRGSYEKFHNLIADTTTGNSGIYNGLPGVAFYYSAQHLYSGPNYLAPQGTFQSDKQIRYDGSWTVGRHNVRYGYSLNRILGGGFAAFFGLSPRISINSGTLLKTCNNDGVSAPCPTDPLHGYHPGTTYIGNGQGFFTENPGFGLIGGGVHDWRSGAYVSDNWKVTPDFTVAAGLRWSVDTDRANQDVASPQCSDTTLLTCTGDLFAQFDPRFTGRVHQPYGNFGPQLGINYSPGNHKTSLRAAFGIFYESDVFNNTTNARNILLKQGAFFDFHNVCSSYKLAMPDGTIAYYIDGSGANSTTGAPSIQSACKAPLAVGGPQIASLQKVYQANTRAHSALANGAYIGQTLNASGAYSPNYKTPYSEQWNLGVQRELWKGAIFSADYVHNSTLRIGEQIDVNHVGAARYFNKTAAQSAIAATTASFGCNGGSSAAAINCAIANGAGIADFANNGLDSGNVYLSGYSASAYGLSYASTCGASASCGAAFPGSNPNLGSGDFIQPIGRSGYDALQVVYRQPAKNFGSFMEHASFQLSYTLSRVVTSSTGGSDQFFSAGSWDNDNPMAYIGRDDLDHTNEFAFGTSFTVKHGPHVGLTGHFNSARPTSLTLDPGPTGAGAIFFSDVTGDGTTGDLAPGTLPGSYMHDLKGKSLNNYISNFNSTQVGRLTPAGQAVVNSGLLTQAQMVALGGALQPIAQSPSTAAILNPAFRSMDLNFSYPIRLKRVREGLSLEPGVAFYNVGNFANYGTQSGVLLNTADAGGDQNSQLGYLSGINSYAALNSSRVQRGSGTFDQGGPRSTEFQLKLNF